MNILFLNEYRCRCGKLLLKGIFLEGALEIKCKHCGQFNNIGTIKDQNKSNQYLLIVNNQKKITNINDSACHILGYTSSELIGKNYDQINPTLPKEIFNKFFKQNYNKNSGDHFQLQTQHISKNGNKISVSLYLKLYQPTPDEKYILVAAELLNKTIKKNVIDTRPKLTFDICDFYFDISKDGTEQFISPEAEKIFGYSVKEVIGNNYFDYLPIAKIIENKNNLKYITNKGFPFRILKDTSKDAKGKTICNDLYFTPTLDNNGKIVGYRIFGWQIKHFKSKKVLTNILANSKFN